MEGYNYYVLNKQNLIIENKKKSYLEKVYSFYDQFNNLLNKKTFIKIDEYKKSMEYYLDLFNFLNQLNNSNILNAFFNFNDKLINLFHFFIKDYNNIELYINSHNKGLVNKKKDNLSDLNISKNILLLVKSLDKSYEKSVLINVLKGNLLDNIKEFKLNESKGFGRLKNINYQDIKKCMEELLQSHYLKYDELIKCIKITKKGIEKLKEM